MTMTPIREVKDILDHEALEGRKIAHGISSPVVICIDDVYVLAAYLFLYTSAQLRDKMIGRPSKWIIADLKTGHVLHRYDCFNVDFSDAPADRLYSIVPEADRNISDEYYHHTDELIDKVRADLLAGRGFDVDTHTEYVRLINANWPREYRRFLTDLASGTFYHRHQESLGDADEATTYSEKTENGTELSDASTTSDVKANVSGDDLTSKTPHG